MRIATLLRASHPQPSLAVTAMAATFASAAGHDRRGIARVAAAVGAGQLSVGWCNDWLDGARDSAVGRTDKPVATGAVTTSQVRGAAVTALVVSALASARLGAPGRRHLAALASAWSYDLGVKSTAMSWAPYAVSFGLLPGVASPAGRTVPPRVTAAAALLGIGAHLANALPDLDDDAATDVRNLATRIGRRPSQLGAAAALLAGTALLTGVRRPAFAAAAGITVVGLAAAETSRRPFLAAMAVAGLDVVLLVRRARVSR
jgi:4-hydroxybenzoate polyprenyltransferase